MFGFLKKLFSNNHEEVKQYLQKGALILDVRSLAEYQSGHVKGSINIPLPQLDAQFQTLKKANKPVVACCASGMRSGRAVAQLKAKGIQSINGGAWTTVKKLSQS